MLQRITYGFVAIVTIVTLVQIDVLVALDYPPTAPFARLFQRGSFIPFTFIVLAVAAARELIALLKRRGCRPYGGVAYLAVLALVSAPWLSSAGWLGTRADQTEGMRGQVILLAGVWAAVMVRHVWRGDPAGTFRDVGATWLVILYAGFLPSFGNQIRCGVNVPGQTGAWAILLIILTTKASDIGGYLVGTLAGRHKLAPAISKGKTVEGTLGGIVASAAVCVGFVAAAELVHRLVNDFSPTGGSTMTPGMAEFTSMFEKLGYTNAVIFGATLAVVGLFGDLFESCFKRDADQKDSGHVIPGYGGILDLTDSPYATLPVAWFMLTDVWGVL